MLCPAVSTQVHDLVGGVVEHLSTDEDDLSESQKLLQRVYSMSIMRLEGHEPDLELWTVSLPGSAVRECIDDGCCPFYASGLESEQVLVLGHTRLP